MRDALPRITLVLRTTEKQADGTVRDHRYELAANAVRDAKGLMLVEAAPDGDADQRFRASRYYLQAVLADDDGVALEVEVHAARPGRWVLAWPDDEPIDDRGFDSREDAQEWADAHPSSRRRLVMVLASETELVALEHLEELVAQVMRAAVAGGERPRRRRRGTG